MATYRIVTSKNYETLQNLYHNGCEHEGFDADGNEIVTMEIEISDSDVEAKLNSDAGVISYEQVA